MNFKIIFLALILAISTETHSKAPVGLNNVGNSCFMNAALQCLSSMTGFTKHFATNNYYKGGSPAQLYKEFLIARSKTSKPMNPTLLAHSSWKMLGAGPLTQQDSDEFLTELLRHIALDDIKNEHVLELVSKWKAYPGTLISQTPANKTFMVQMESQLTAPAEDFLALQSEPLGVMSLPINPSDKHLKDCLNNFFASEEIADYLLPSGNKGGVQKKLSLEVTGQYLLLTLKRNEFRFGELIRHENALTIPLAGLDLAPYFSDKAYNKGSYELIGMIMHGGSAKGGHYTAYVKDGHQWYYCNDTSISSVSAAEMNQIAARGYGVSQNTIPTTLVYELSSERTKALAAETAARLLALRQAAQIKNHPLQNKVPQAAPKVIKKNPSAIKNLPAKNPGSIAKKNTQVLKKSMPVKQVTKMVTPVKKAPVIKKVPIKMVAPPAKKPTVPVKKALPKPVAKIPLKAPVKKTNIKNIPTKIVKK